MDENFFKEHVEDLVKIARDISEKTKKIAEASASTWDGEGGCLYYEIPRTVSEDIIIKIETTGITSSSQEDIISFAIIDNDGMKIYINHYGKSSVDDALSSTLIGISSKNVYLYHREFTERFLGKVPNAYDLRAYLLRKLGYYASSSDDGPKDKIINPWDPLKPSKVPMTWNKGEYEVVMRHAVAEALRLYYIYLMYKMDPDPTRTSASNGPSVFDTPDAYIDGPFDRDDIDDPYADYDDDIAGIDPRDLGGYE